MPGRGRQCCKQEEPVYDHASCPTACTGVLVWFYLAQRSRARPEGQHRPSGFSQSPAVESPHRAGADATITCEQPPSGKCQAHTLRAERLRSFSIPRRGLRCTLQALNSLQLPTTLAEDTFRKCYAASLCSYFLFIYSSVSGGGGGSQAGSTLSAEPNVGRNFTTLRS